MFKKSSEMETNIIKNMRGGKGEVEMKHIYKQDELTGKARIFAKATINPGCSIGLHERSTLVTPC
ncbi:MAG: cupin [Clostridiales bacterium]|nr:cupin [Clostridiales bacterium]